jgi:hypothetical protein
MVPVRNLLLEFEVPFIFHIMLIKFCLSAYQEIKARWKELGQFTH